MPSLFDGLSAQPPLAPGPSPAPVGPPGRRIDDVAATRTAIYDSVLSAFRGLAPATNTRFSLRLDNLDYEDPDDVPLKKQKDAILRGQTLARRIRGDWVLADADGNEVERKRTTVAQVPHLTQRGTYIVNGSEYTLANQMRLRPGVFTRQKENGELESHLNVLPGQGMSHRYSLDPETGMFRAQFGQAKLPLLPILRAAGATDDELKDAWGGELLAANLKKDDARGLDQAYAKLLPKGDPRADAATKRQAIAAFMGKMAFDPAVTARTLGAPHANLSKAAMLDTTRKLLAVSRGEADSDDRDHLANQLFFGPEDLYGERARRAGPALSRLLWQATYSKSLKRVQPNALTSQVQAALLDSGLGNPLEEVNAADVYDQLSRVTRLGVGGIPSLDSVPLDSRSVQPSHFGYIDPIRTPESLKAGVDGWVTSDVRKGADGTLYAQFKSRDGADVWLSPEQAFAAPVALPGELSKTDRYVAAVRDGRVDMVDRAEVAHELPAFDGLFSGVANLVPFRTGNKGHRLMMGSRFITQALPLVGAEAPLVRSAGLGGVSYDELYGDRFGVVRAETGGRVQAVDRDGITVRYEDGRTETHQLYDHQPYNRKSVTGDTDIYIRRDGTVRVLPIGGYVYRLGDQTLSVDPATKRSAWLPVTGYVAHENDKRLLRVTTRSGRSVTVTEDHSLVTLGESGHLVPLFPDQCVVGKTLLPVAAMPVVDGVGTCPYPSDDHAALFGLYLAEGWTCGESQPGRMEIAVQPVDRGRQVVDLFARLGFTSRHLHGRVGCTSKAMVGFIEANFGRGSANKRVPDFVFNMPRRYRQLLLAGYLAGDGCLNVDGNGVVQLAAFSVSSRLRDGLVDLLSSLGVFATVASRQLSKTREQWNDAYGFRVVNGHLAKLDRWFFYDDRQSQLERLVKEAYRASPYELVPVPPAARSRLYDEWLGDVPGYIHKTAAKGAVAKWRLQECQGVFGQWGNSDVLWDPVVSIEPVPHQSRVFDLAVTSSEVFAVNRGLVVHNTQVHNTPLVQPGDPVQAGQVLARSNFTDDRGVLALGRNLRTAYVPFRGLAYEDAVVISESAAKKLTSEHLYQHEAEFDADSRRGKNAYVSIFPATFDRRQLDTIDDDGAVLPGTVVQPGDPLVLSAAPRPLSHKQVHAVHKGTFRDQATTWEHHVPGTVTDVAKTPKGVVVTVTANMPMVEADKLAARFGDKGVVSKIVPDDEMPHDSEGRPFELILNPLGVISRANAGQVYEALLGKIAAKTGKPYEIPDIGGKGDWTDFVETELRKHGLSDTETITDPTTGRKIPGVLTGVRYAYKLHHMASAKDQGRGLGAYTADDVPAKTGGAEGSSKRLALQDSNALLSSGATEVLRDAKLIRGQKNQQYWSDFMAGNRPGTPDVPFVYRKFVERLRGAGINVVRHGTKSHLYALTDADIDDLSGDRELQNADTVNWEDGMKPVPGGLFDPTLTGGHGNQGRWAHIRLAEPMPSPVMEEPIRRVLGLTQARFDDVLAGKERLNGLAGPRAIHEALKGIDLDGAIAQARADVRSGRATVRDAAVRRLGFLAGAKKAGIHPSQWVWAKLPVLPPAFRPISMMQQTKSPLVADANILYKDCFEANANLADLKDRVADVGQERLSLYGAMKAVVGLGDPIQPKNQEKQIRGLLQHVFGWNPKQGTVQQQLLGSGMDLVGRAVIIPNPDLSLDEVGLPEERAWTVYSPFLVRRMVRDGVPRLQALQYAKDRTPLARKALLAEMDSRPVVVSRAPVLHRFGEMAFMPKLVKGDAMHVNPSIVAGFGADFDGNCVDFDTELLLFLDQSLLHSSTGNERSSWETLVMRTTGNTLVDVIGENGGVVRIKIGDFPRGGVVSEQGNQTTRSVPAGVRIVSYDSATGKPVLGTVTQFTVDRDHACETVRTSRGREVTVSDNESLCVFDHENGGIVKLKPAGAVGRFVPYVKRDPLVGDKYDREIGWWYGALIADGWVQQRTVGYAKNEEAKRTEFVRIAKAKISDAFTPHEYVFEQTPGKYSGSTKVHLNGQYLAAKVLSVVDPSHADAPEGERAALFKRIPDDLLHNGSRECLLGLLAGLLDGGSTVGWNKATGKPRAVIKFNTSSPYLVAGIQSLLRKLGVRSSVTVTPARGLSRQSYTICPGVNDMFAVLKECQPVGAEEKAFVDEFLKTEATRSGKDDIDVVPVTVSLATDLSRHPAFGLSFRSLFNDAKRKHSVSRATARKAVAGLGVEFDHPHWGGFVAMTRCDDVHWEAVETSTAVGRRDVFDLTVVGADPVFAIANGLIIWDTSNYHVPASDEARDEAVAKLLPSRNLLSVKSFKADNFIPRQEYLAGLHAATTRRDPLKPVRTFATTAAAVRAYYNGELDVDTPVEILDQRGTRK